MKKRILSGVLAGVLMVQAVWLGACGSKDAEAIGAQVQPESVQAAGAEEENTVMSAGAEESSMDFETEAADTDAVDMAAQSEMQVKNQDGVNGFAFRFTQALLEKKEAGENLIVSPYSVWLPLAALVNATDEEAGPQLLNALGQADADAAALNEAVKALNSALCQEERAAWFRENNMEFESPLKIANAVFIGQDEVMKQDFADVYSEIYGGRVFQVDFSSPSAADAVNAWAGEQTNGRIQEIINGFDPRTVAAIANAIYFSDGWNKEFPTENTRNDVFHSAAGEETVPFMNHKLVETCYYEDADMQATVLGTQRGGQLVICLPKEGKTAEEVLLAMNPEKLEQIRQSNGFTVQLSLPKFKLESGVFSVKEAMEMLGVPLSDENVPHIDGLAEGDPLYISQAVQKAMLEVDEKGMTAAAVTVMGLQRMAMPIEQEPVEMKFDRPFAFVLTADGGEAGQQVLFTGVVNQIGE